MKNSILIVLVMFLLLSGMASFAVNKSCSSHKCLNAGGKAKACVNCAKAKCVAGKDCTKDCHKTAGHCDKK